MSEQITASVGLSLTRTEIEQIYFTPSIEFPVDDRNSPPIYMPEVVVAQDCKLPKELEDEVWKQHDKDDPLSGNNGGDDPLKLGDTVHVNSTIPIKLANDQGKATEYKTDEMKLVRFGSQVMHVFGPATHLACGAFRYDPETNISSRWCSNIPVEEKVIVFSKLNQSESGQDGDSNAENTDASSDYNSRFNRYENGQFNQQNDKENIANASAYLLKMWFAGRWWRKTFLIPANRNGANKQINFVGRKVKWMKETLHFSGSQEQGIKYWYDNPEINVAYSSMFIDENGNEVALPKQKEQGKFVTPKPVWGSISVEYQTSYSEFLLLYDYPNMQRSYEVLPGAIEKVGYITVDTNDKPIAEKSGEPKRQGYSLRDGGFGFKKKESGGGYILEDRRDQGLADNLVEGDLSYDRIELDKDWIRQNKSKSDYKLSNAPQVALKLLKKLRFKPVSVQPIDIFYTNGKRSVSASFSAPAPIILDMPEKELPKIAIFEKRLREKTAAGGWNINVVEVRFLDILGNVTQEKLEMGWKTDWKNKPSKGVGP